MGDEHYPLPWSTLKYDTSLGGYIVNLTKDQLDKAPKYHQTIVGTGVAQTISACTSTIRLARTGASKQPDDGMHHWN